MGNGIFSEENRECYYPTSAVTVQEVNATGRERQVGANTEVVGAAERIIGQNQVEADAAPVIAANLPVSSPPQTAVIPNVPILCFAI